MGGGGVGVVAVGAAKSLLFGYNCLVCMTRGYGVCLFDCFYDVTALVRLSMPVIGVLFVMTCRCIVIVISPQ